MAIKIIISDTDLKVNGMRFTKGFNGDLIHGNDYSEKIIGYYEADTMKENLKIARMLGIKFD